MDVALGYNEEEMKMVKETHKIWNEKAVRACSRPGHLKSAWRQEHAC
jgi:aspartate-semialdehyde dehydrogenase